MTILIAAVAAAVLVASIVLVRRKGTGATVVAGTTAPEHPDPWVRHGLRCEAMQAAGEGKANLFPDDPRLVRPMPAMKDLSEQAHDILQ